ncbi:hypothetical protein DPEC_G00367320, partial [Dallia pectoralis]
GTSSYVFESVEVLLEDVAHLRQEGVSCGVSDVCDGFPVNVVMCKHSGSVDVPVSASKTPSQRPNSLELPAYREMGVFRRPSPGSTSHPWRVKVPGRGRGLLCQGGSERLSGEKTTSDSDSVGVTRRTLEKVAPVCAGEPDVEDLWCCEIEAYARLTEETPAFLAPLPLTGVAPRTGHLCSQDIKGTEEESRAKRRSRFSSCDSGTTKSSLKHIGTNTNQYGLYGKTRAQEDAKPIHEREKKRWREARWGIRNSLLTLRQERREAKERQKTATGSTLETGETQSGSLWRELVEIRTEEICV